MRTVGIESNENEVSRTYVASSNTSFSFSHISSIVAFKVAADVKAPFRGVFNNHVPESKFMAGIVPS